MVEHTSANNNKHQLRDLATKSQILWPSSMLLQKLSKTKIFGFDVLAKVKGVWLIAKSIEDLIPMLVSVLRPSKGFSLKGYR